MITMANMAENRGGINRMEDYLYDMPDGNEYKTLFCRSNSACLLDAW